MNHPHKPLRRLLSAALAAVLLLSTLVTPAAAADGGAYLTRVDNDAVTAQLPLREAGSESQAPVYRDSDVVRVSILLEQEPTIARFDTKGIAENRSAARYRQRLEKRQETMAATISRKALDGEKLDVCWNLTLAANLISANVAYGRIDAIRSVRGVKDVVIETRYEPCRDEQETADPNTATSAAMIGTSAAYATGYTGAGQRIAIIDTGICAGHRSFDADAFLYALQQDAQAAGQSYEDYTASLNLLDAEEIAQKLPQLHIKDGYDAGDLYRSAKIAFSYNYVDKDLRIDHNDNSAEHGSHVSGIAAANRYVSDGRGGYENALEAVHVQGVAPDAQIVTMKVFGTKGGAYESDYMAAIEDAIVLGCDTINMSLGSSTPGYTKTDESVYQEIIDGVEKTSTVIAISSGNSYSWAANAQNPGQALYAGDVSLQTGGAPGTYRNSLCVASVNNDGYTGSYFISGGQAVFYNESEGFKNAPLTTLTGDQAYILIDGLGTPEEFTALRSVLAGKIAVCARGSLNFAAKGNNAVEYGGAAGTIVYNDRSGIFAMDLTAYAHREPCVSVTQADGRLLRDNAQKKTLADGTVYYEGTLTVSDGIGSTVYGSEFYTMSPFSSWGVPGDLSMKPEITAPGGSIYSVNGLKDNTSYETMSGTSMAAPQVAGMSALAAQYIRESGLDRRTGLSVRTLAQSLLMSTAKPLEQSAGQYYSVLEQGAGLANVGAVTTADSYLLMDQSATASYADGKIKAELGDDPDRIGIYNVAFTINNPTEKDERFTLSAQLFTQALFEEAVNEKGDMGSYMDLATANLQSVADWTADGKAVSAAPARFDFNGDGAVNGQDCLALLDVVTGKRTELSNRENADFDGDGRITSYDAQRFLEQMQTAEPTVDVPAGSSVKVSVTLTLTDSQKKALDDNYPNGAYVEGYVFARSDADREGAAGTSHSIPVLGFYGRWSDPSMYETGTLVQRSSGEEVRDPYTGNADTNYFLVSYADDPAAAYCFGGNPVIPTESYHPERNALNTQRGDTVSAVQYTLIRNASAGRISVRNLTRDTQETTDLPEAASAFYYANEGKWYLTGSRTSIHWTPNAAREGDQMEARLTMATEYDVRDDGTVDWNSLGAGASLSVPFVIDNTAPVMTSQPVLAGKTLRMTARDNQYIAAVALYSADGGELVGTYPVDQDKAGADTAITLDLSRLPDAVYTVQLVDYALNISTYRLFLNTEPTHKVERVQLSSSRLQLIPGNSSQLTASVLPVTVEDDSVVWTASDESIAAVSDTGVVTAIRPGTCTVRATSRLDSTKYAECTVTAFTIDKELNAVVFGDNEETSLVTMPLSDPAHYTVKSKLDRSYFSMSYGGDGQLYAATAEDGYSTLYRLDPATMDAAKLETQQAVYADMAPAPSVNGRKGGLAAVYGPYLLLLDSDGNYVSAAEECSNYLVGIAYKGTTYNRYFDTWLDTYLLIDDQGNVYLQSIGYVPIYGGYYTFVAPENSLQFRVNVRMDISYYGCSAYYDGDWLYWSVMDSSSRTSTLFAINDFNGSTQTLGQFEDGDWPVVGLTELGKPLYANRADETLAALTETAAAMDVADLPALTPQGGLHSTAESAAEDPSQVTVAVTVQEAAKNGKMTVSYDPAVLELQSVEGLAAYVSDNARDGEVTLAWAGTEAIELAARLTFRRLTNDAATVTVTTLEQGDQLDLHQVEEITLDAIPCVHQFGPWTVSKSATCTEKGVETRTCSLCGQTETREIPAAGHVEELRNEKEASCTQPGFTGDVYCARCGKLLREGRDIAALGHDYADGRCTRCGEKQPGTNPGVKTGDESRTLLWMAVAAMSCTAAMLLRRKRTR